MSQERPPHALGRGNARSVCEYRLARAGPGASPEQVVDCECAVCCVKGGDALWPRFGLVTTVIGGAPISLGSNSSGLVDSGTARVNRLFRPAARVFAQRCLSARFAAGGPGGNASVTASTLTRLRGRSAANNHRYGRLAGPRAQQQ